MTLHSPNQDEDKQLEAILVEYGRFMQRNSPERANAVRQQYRRTKVALRTLLIEARLEELQAVHDRWRQTYQSEKVQSRVDMRILELEQQLQAREEK